MYKLTVFFAAIAVATAAISVPCPSACVSGPICSQLLSPPVLPPQPPTIVCVPGVNPAPIPGIPGIPGTPGAPGTDLLGILLGGQPGGSILSLSLLNNLLNLVIGGTNPVPPVLVPGANGTLPVDTGLLGGLLPGLLGGLPGGQPGGNLLNLNLLNLLQLGLLPGNGNSTLNPILASLLLNKILNPNAGDAIAPPVGGVCPPGNVPVAIQTIPAIPVPSPVPVPARPCVDPCLSGFFSAY